MTFPNFARFHDLRNELRISLFENFRETASKHNSQKFFDKKFEFEEKKRIKDMLFNLDEQMKENKVGFIFRGGFLLDEQGLFELKCSVEWKWSSKFKN